MSTFRNKNSLRTIEAQIVQKLKNNVARPKFTGYYKKKACNKTSLTTRFAMQFFWLFTSHALQQCRGKRFICWSSVYCFSNKTKTTRLDYISHIYEIELFINNISENLHQVLN